MRLTPTSWSLADEESTSSLDWRSSPWTLPRRGDDAPAGKALVVDESLALCLQVGRALRDLGLESEFAATTDEARRVGNNNRYDIIVLDVGIEDGAGFHLCRELATNSIEVAPPVVAFTARDSLLDRLHGRMAGCSAYLVKPTSLDIFTRIVWRHAGFAPRGGDIRAA